MQDKDHNDPSVFKNSIALGIYGILELEADVIKMVDFHENPSAVFPYFALEFQKMEMDFIPNNGPKDLELPIL